MVIKNGFLSKSSKFHVVCDHTILFKFTSIWYKHFLKNVWRDFRLLISALATEAQKSFNGKFTAKTDFLIGHFYVTIADTDIGSLKSFHTLFDKYLDHMLVKFEQNRMVRTIGGPKKFVLFDKKWLTTFDKVLTPFW